jgi:hypothetical protein
MQQKIPWQQIWSIAVTERSENDAVGVNNRFNMHLKDTLKTWCPGCSGLTTMREHRDMSTPRHAGECSGVIASVRRLRYTASPGAASSAGVGLEISAGAQGVTT